MTPRPQDRQSAGGSRERVVARSLLAAEEAKREARERDRDPDDEVEHGERFDLCD